MKIHRFTILAALLTSTAFAQTNTFPTSGNVGIGTTAPIYLLNVVANSAATDHWLGVFSPGSDTNGYRKELILGYHGGDDYAYIQGHHQNVRWSDLVLQRYGGRVGIGTTTPSATLTVTNGDDARLKLYSNGGSVAVIDAVANSNDSVGRWLSINPSGANVGIGMTNPTHKLEVLGDVKAGGSSWSGFYTGANGAIATLRVSDTASYGTTVGFTGTDTNNPFVIRANAEPVAWFAPSGYVGIGTLNPLAKLDVTGGEIRIPGGSSTGSWSTDIGNVTHFNYAGNGKNYIRGTTIIADNGGNVGIGTPNPQHKLAVNGTIKAKEVIVETTGWSDYVFADDYALQPLSQVEAHIKEHKHLPGIPSASEVASKGVNVGDMQAALLAKVEELTLHMIAQEKEMSRLRETEKEVAALRVELQQLRQSK